MISADIPGFGRLELVHLISDYNGTLAFNGILLHGVASRLKALARVVTIHVVTADTFGLARQQLEGLPVRLAVIALEDQAGAKWRYLQALGAGQTVAVGNGRNDRKMLKAAALGLAVIQGEGASAAAITGADLVTTSILDALDILANPDRLKATLRS